MCACGKQLALRAASAFISSGSSHSQRARMLSVSAFTDRGTQVREDLEAPFAALLGAARRVAKASNEAKLPLDAPEYVARCAAALALLPHQAACVQSSAQQCIADVEAPDVQWMCS